MKPAYLFRNTLLTGVCIGLLAGCSWLEDWPPKGSEMAAKTAPKPPESKILQTSEGSWLQSDKKVAVAEPKGVVAGEESSDRIAQLEASVDELRNDLQMMMPALTKLAEAQVAQVEPAGGNIAPVVVSDEGMAQAYGQPQSPQPMPIANASAQPGNIPQVPPQFDPAYSGGYQQPAAANAGPAPGSVAWYEDMERQQRQQERQGRNGNAQQQQPQQWQQPAPQPQAYQPPPAQYQQQPAYQPAAYQQPPAYQPPPQSYQQPAAATYGGQPPSVSAGIGGGSYVSGVRFGEHADKTRVVLDTGSNVAFSYDMDTHENILVITLPGTEWRAAREMAIGNSPMVASYSVIPDNTGGSQVIMQLKHPARVLWAQALEPGGPQGYRIVLDVAPI